MALLLQACHATPLILYPNCKAYCQLVYGTTDKKMGTKVGFIFKEVLLSEEEERYSLRPIM